MQRFAIRRWVATFAERRLALAVPSLSVPLPSWTGRPESTRRFCAGTEGTNAEPANDVALKRKACLEVANEAVEDAARKANPSNVEPLNEALQGRAEVIASTATSMLRDNDADTLLAFLDDAEREVSDGEVPVLDEFAIDDPAAATILMYRAKALASKGDVEAASNAAAKAFDVLCLTAPENFDALSEMCELQANWLADGCGDVHAAVGAYDTLIHHIDMLEDELPDDKVNAALIHAREAPWLGKLAVHQRHGRHHDILELFSSGSLPQAVADGDLSPTFCERAEEFKAQALAAISDSPTTTPS